MADYEVSSAATPAAAAGAAYCTLHTGASVPAKIWEIAFWLGTATATSVGLTRATNTPVATTSALGQKLDPASPASTLNLDTAWSTPPTTAAPYLRSLNAPASGGAGTIWVFQRPLILAVSQWLVLWNFGAGAGAALSVYFSWSE
jgi:hypothetical protein